MVRDSTFRRVTSQHLEVWNHRLMTAAVLLILFGFDVLAIRAAGPEARVMMAGEGVSYHLETELIRNAP
jgi:hypothetical protein